MHKIEPYHFTRFKEFMSDKAGWGAAYHTAKDLVDLAAAAESVKVSGETLAEYIAEHTGLPYIAFINPENIIEGILSEPFCRKNLVVTLKGSDDSLIFVVWNPFDVDLLLTLQHSARGPFTLGVAARQTIEFLLGIESDVAYKSIHSVEEPLQEGWPATEENGGVTIQHLNSILHQAIAHGASDIHMEPKEAHIVVRFRVDGDMREACTLKKESGFRIISRLKALADLDITEKRRTQDGALEAVFHGKTYKMRLATTSTPYGESLIIRLLDMSKQWKSLNELGMTAKQSQSLKQLLQKGRGIVLIVGATGSGKTTTIYSVLKEIDCQARSLISVEDPVEYKMAFANQQQVNEKAGITFETLLKSSVRQDPDILFIGEMRDAVSSKIAMDFASTGHLTITSLHTSNATTAMFRLERLGIGRGPIADIVLGIVAQKLIKKLCPHCKTTKPLAEEERRILAPFLREPLPERTAHPVGCVQCSHTGYLGREGVYEIIEFDPEIAALVRAEKPIAEIREFARNRGDHLLRDHALDKVHSLLSSLQEVYQKVLVEEPETDGWQTGPKRQKGPCSVLLVEDDPISAMIIERFLKNAGMEVDKSADGVEALLMLGRKQFDIILSDIEMPNLDGFKLIEMKTMKGIDTPVLFMTSRTSQEDEIKALELGASDYLRKPVEKDVLLLRVKNALR